MNRIILYPYKMGSASAKAIQANLMQEVGHTHKTLRVYPNRRYRKRSTDLVINWGASREAQWGSPSLNQPAAVTIAANKLKTFEALRDVCPLPQWTTDKQSAQHWVNDGYKVFCRQLLTGSGGDGIIVSSEGVLPDAPLYTRSFNKTREYRVHVWKGNILDVQEKRKREGTGVRSDNDVWNFSNDFIFARESIELPPEIREVAIEVVHSLHLDFGAIDIGYNHREGTMALFEVNTAPGLTGTTLNKYVEAIINEL